MKAPRKVTPVVCAFLLWCAWSGSFAEWQHLGLAERCMRSIRLNGGFMYASTDSGVYRLRLGSPLPTWTPLGLQGMEVRALLVCSTDTIFAGLTSGEVSIYRTVDGGANWVPFENGYGGGSFHPVNAFDRLPGQGDTLSPREEPLSRGQRMPA